MINPFVYKKLLTTNNASLPEPLEQLLKENGVDCFVRTDNMFWVNFMGESRFICTRKAKQNYTIFVKREQFQASKMVIDKATYAE